MSEIRWIKQYKDIVSTDGSITITKTFPTDPKQRVIDLAANPVGGSSSANIVLFNIPCDSSVFIGAVVRMSGGIAVNAKADSVLNSNIFGIAQAKPTSTTCNIRVSGISPGIYAGLDESKEYFLSDTSTGQITATPPAGTGHVIVRVGQPFSSTELFVDKGQRIVLT